MTRGKTEAGEERYYIKVQQEDLMRVKKNKKDLSGMEINMLRINKQTTIMLQEKKGCCGIKWGRQYIG